METDLFVNLSKPRTSHRFHADDRTWSLTNCYVDMWIEILHARGQDAVSALGFTVTQNFEGDQFTFMKFTHADLATQFAVIVKELALYDKLENHVATQVSQGNIALLEMDGFYLPDTKTTSYHTLHAKTMIGVDRIDLESGRCEYFHNGGYYTLNGEDYRSAFSVDKNGGGPMFFYAEFARFEEPPVHDQRLVAHNILAQHLAQRPRHNPISSFRAAFPAQLSTLLVRPPAYFHLYTFNILRQLGANFALLGDHLSWLDIQGGGLCKLAKHCMAISETARLMQMRLARSVARQRMDLQEDAFDTMEHAYSRLFEGLVHHAG